MIKEISDKFCKEFQISEGLVDWDNIGILINSSNTTNNVLLTIDFTDEVIEECISNKIKNVIAYHPVIFKGIKNVNETDIVYKCIRNGISVYCPHTSLDKRMNEYLLRRIQKEMNVFSDCFYESLVCIGKINKSTNEILSCVKKLLNLKHVRIAYPKKREFIPEKVLVGVGAGFTYVNHSNSLIITGEMRHHEILHSVKKGNFVILVEHSNGERFFLNELEKICKNILPNFIFYVSKNDKDPIEIE